MFNFLKGGERIMYIICVKMYKQTRQDASVFVKSHLTNSTELALAARQKHGT